MERITANARVGFGSMTVSLHEMDAIDLGRQYDKPVPAHNRASRMAHRSRHPVLCGSTRDENDVKWFGGLRNVADGTAIFETGWPEGANRLKAMVEKLAAEIPPAKSVRRRLRWSDDGDEVSKDRLNGGQVDSCWRTTRRELSEGSEVVTLETNWGGPCNVAAEQLFWQGAAAACLTDVLEEAGYRVEVYATNCSDHHHGKTVVRVRLKEADQPTRLDTLAAVMCHAGVYRIFGLSAKEQANFPINNNYGSTVKLAREQFEALQVTLGQGGTETICFGQIYDEQSAVLAIEQEIARLQGHNP